MEVVDLYTRYNKVFFKVFYFFNVPIEQKERGKGNYRIESDSFISSVDESRCLNSNDPIISIYHRQLLLFFPSLTVVITQLLNAYNFCLR